MRILAAHSAEFRLRRMLPALTVALAALIDLAPVPDVAPAGHAANLTVAVVFFWSLHRPDLLQPVALFAIALAADLVAGVLIGLGPLSLLAVRQGVVRQQRLLLAASPVMRWAGFACFAAGVALLGWLVASALALRWQAAMPVLGDLVVTVMAWPVVAVLLAQVQAMLPRLRHAAGS
jgi:rod shape-determining protein MreD